MATTGAPGVESRESLDGSAAAIGAAVGGLVTLVVLGGIVLLLVVFVGAVIGGVVALGVSLAVAALRGRRTEPSGDHGDSPGFGPVAGDTGAEAQRTEAGHVSPSA
jgi:hypothetical protein